MKRAFTLLELMVAVLLGALVVLMIAGSMQNSIRAWEAAQTRIAENYEHRTVLDLIKRQSSSIFYRRDADSIIRQDTDNAIPNRQQPNRQQPGQANQPTPRRNDMSTGRVARGDPNEAINKPNNRSNVKPNNTSQQFELPGGAHFFKGSIQALSFMSTVSFLSDFPGQCAVKYYVFQTEEDSENDGATPGVSTPPEGYLDEEYEALESGLWLVLEERNLFVSETQQDEANDPLLNDDPEDPNQIKEEQEETIEDESFEDLGDIESTQSMVLLGPLRKFSIRYRTPKKPDNEDDEEDDKWAEYWDYNANNGYPSAIEFILVYEKPGIDDETETDDLPGVRMVIPVYDLQNLRRDRSNVPF